MDDLDLDELQTILKNITESAYCVVCLGCLRPPVSLCVNGHLICSKCNKSNQCPNCRDKFSNVNNCNDINKILQAIPRANVNADCTSGYCEENSHHSTCAMRSTQCLIKNCNWSGSVKVLIDHLKNAHKSISVFENKECKLGYVSFLDHSISKKFCILPFSSNGCFYWIYIHINRNDSVFNIFLRCIPSNESHLESVSVIKIEKGNVKFAYSQKVFQSDVDLKSILEEKKCMAVPLKFLDNLIDEDNCLKFTCEIVNLDN